MAKWKEIPSPEAIVRAACERAAIIADCSCTDHCENWPRKCAGTSAHTILTLASDPAEVAAIIKKAGKDRG